MRQNRKTWRHEQAPGSYEDWELRRKGTSIVGSFANRYGSCSIQERMKLRGGRVTGYDQIEHSRLTHVGVRRSHNQDSSAVLLAADPDQWRQRGHVFLVADGMGGHAVGELASELASSIIPHTYHKYS